MIDYSKTMPAIGTRNRIEHTSYRMLKRITALIILLALAGACALCETVTAMPSGVRICDAAGEKMLVCDMSEGSYKVYNGTNKEYEKVTFTDCAVEAMRLELSISRGFDAETVKKLDDDKVISLFAMLAGRTIISRYSFIADIENACIYAPREIESEVSDYLGAFTTAYSTDGSGSALMLSFENKVCSATLVRFDSAGNAAGTVLGEYGAGRAPDTLILCDGCTVFYNRSGWVYSGVFAIMDGSDEVVQLCASSKLFTRLSYGEGGDRILPYGVLSDGRLLVYDADALTLLALDVKNRKAEKFITAKSLGKKLGMDESKASYVLYAAIFRDGGLILTAGEEISAYIRF